MVKKTITYTNPFTDQQVIEDHYFHISKADLVEMEMEEHNARYVKDGDELTGMRAHLQKIIDSDDGRAVLKEFKAILRRAYGKKDGTRFVKNAEIWAEFEGSDAYSELIFELLTDPAGLAEFINSVVPKNLEQVAAEVAARQSGSTPDTPATVTPIDSTRDPEGVLQKKVETAKDPTGLTEKVTPRVLTISETAEMDAEELKAGLADGRYKLS